MKNIPRPNKKNTLATLSLSLSELGTPVVGRASVLLDGRLATRE